MTEELDQEECPGAAECDDDGCQQREEYEVTMTRTVTFTARVHDTDELDSIVWQLDVSSDPHETYIEGWSVDDDCTYESETEARERWRARARTANELDAALAEEGA